jgi:hypothetical protein
LDTRRRKLKSKEAGDLSTNKETEVFGTRGGRKGRKKGVSEEKITKMEMDFLDAAGPKLEIRRAKSAIGAKSQGISNTLKGGMVVNC